MGAFVFTDDMANANATNTMAWAFISGAPCIGMLVAAGLVYSVPEAREKLNRISFRLMIWSMVLEIGYNICYIMEEPYVYAGATGVSCTIMVYFQIATMSATCYLCTCIAINLALYVSFHIDTVGRRFERWYLLGSLGLGFGIPIIPAALGHFGPDPVLVPGTCYFSSSDPTQRLLQFGIEIYLWQGISSVIATISVIIVWVTLIRQGRETARYMFGGHAANSDMERGHALADVQLNYLQKKLAGILIRISLYPITLIVVTTIISVGDMYTSWRNGPQSWADYVYFVIYYFLYGARSLPFALLGIFVDPSLVRGIRCAWDVKRHGRSTQHSSATPVLNDYQGAEGEDEGDIDFFAALTESQFSPATYTGTLAVTYSRTPQPDGNSDQDDFPSEIMPALPELTEEPHALSRQPSPSKGHDVSTVVETYGDDKGSREKSVPSRQSSALRQSGGRRETSRTSVSSQTSWPGVRRQRRRLSGVADEELEKALDEAVQRL